MMKRIYISSLLIMLSSVMFGQFVGKDNFSKAMYYLQKQEVDSAKKYIDIALANPDHAEELKVLYYKGYIYKELYKKYDKSKKTSVYRNEAIESLTKVLNSGTENELSLSAKKMLNYLSSTLYNDAVKSLNSESYRLAEINYNNYRDVIVLVNPEINLGEQDVKFKMALASMFVRELEDTLIKQVVKGLYLEVLAIDSNNANANYNLGILFYNEGADLINAMDYDMDLEAMSRIQDRCVDLFLSGAPYMERAYLLDYKKQETLLGLSNIYYGLNNSEKSEFYKKKLKELGGKSNAQD